MNRELNIPEKLEDITLKQWQEISMIPEESEQEFYTRRILSIIYDLKGAEINKIKGTDIIKLVDAVNICLNEKPEFKNRFMMDEVEYGLIPNFDDMSFGELVDIDKYSSKEQYHKLMGVLYRPIEKTQSGDRYELEKYEKAKDMSGMRVDIALGVIGFFLTIASQLINDTLSSLTPQEVAAAKRLDSIKNGGGTLPYMPSLMEIFYN